MLHDPVLDLMASEGRVVPSWHCDLGNPDHLMRLNFFCKLAVIKQSYQNSTVIQKKNWGAVQFLVIVDIFTVTSLRSGWKGFRI
jgi:hypothetical protein